MSTENHNALVKEPEKRRQESAASSQIMAMIMAMINRLLNAEFN